MASYHFAIRSGKRGQASEHAAYIARQGKHSKGDKAKDLVVVEHGNLPEWAKGNPQVFWRAADRYERSNGSTYREFEVALPNELSKEQNLDLVRDFIKKEIGSKTYQLAIHAPIASLGNVAHPHAHLQSSDRMPDKIVRTPDMHFKRHNSVNPEKGGCRKDSGGKDPKTLKSDVVRLRESWADLQNKHLALHGFSARVDSRSNKARGIEQVPEKHLGPSRIRNMTDEEVQAYQSKRQGAC